MVDSGINSGLPDFSPPQKPDTSHRHLTHRMGDKDPSVRGPTREKDPAMWGLVEGVAGDRKDPCPVQPIEGFSTTLKGNAVVQHTCKQSPEAWLQSP